MDTEVVFVLKGKVKTHEERMGEESEDFLLTTDVLHLLLSNNVSLVQDLHCGGGGGRRRGTIEEVGRRWEAGGGGGRGEGEGGSGKVWERRRGRGNGREVGEGVEDATVKAGGEIKRREGRKGMRMITEGRLWEGVQGQGGGEAVEKDKKEEEKQAQREQAWWKWKQKDLEEDTGRD